MTFPDDEQEFQRNWSMKAGEVSALKRAALLAEEASARYFVRRQDQTASAIRDLSVTIGVLATAAQQELEEFIKEDKRRTWEKTKPLRY
jgi:hypothetical protein